MKLNKRLVFPLGFVCGLFIAWVIYKPLSAPPKWDFGTHGYFPLYDTNCVTRVYVKQHPYRLLFKIVIETAGDAPLCLDGSKLSVEGFNAEGEKVFYEEIGWRDFMVHSPHPSDFPPRWSATIFRRDAFPGEKHASAGVSYLPFKQNEKCFYVIRVISPCEKYECDSTTLESKMFN